MASRPPKSPAQPPPPVRVDLHCHSAASTEAGEAVLAAINCPESFSDPLEVYEQAKLRGMDFVTITDHDTIAGVAQLADRPDVLIGEELTCYFPEDDCKIHLLLWGIEPHDHDALQAVAKDIYKVARYVAHHRLAHAVAHPLYRQNDRLEKWHLERLILLFKGFEVLNGAHSNLHREAFEPLLDDLTPREVSRLAAVHDLEPLWAQPHVKARTAGSDDHGLFNIGRTWTQFPPTATTAARVLDCLRSGACAPGGEAGSSLKLAHNFLGVGVRYYARRLVAAGARPTKGAVLMQTLVGEKLPYRRRDLVRMAVRDKARRLGGRLLRPFRKPKPAPQGVDLLLDLFLKSLTARFAAHTDLTAALRDRRASLAEHESIFRLVSEINRDVSAGIAASVGKSVARGELPGVFDALGAVAAHQFTLLPYYFALFHQNRERHLLSRLTGRPRATPAAGLRVAAFTDTFDEINGVTRFTRDVAGEAARRGHAFTVHTCTPAPAHTPVWRKNFTPLVSQRFPMYAHLELNLPPVVEVLEWCDRQQFDAVYVETPGPMGLCGLLAAAMLRVPVLGTYHTDFPAYVRDFTGDHRLSCAAEAYVKWFHTAIDTTFCRTRHYQGKLKVAGVPESKLALAPPAIDATVFNPTHRDPNLWPRLGVRETRQLLFCGRVSVEKNLPFLVESFKRLCLLRRDTALVVAGDGPYLGAMRRELRGLPAYFLGFQDDAGLAPLYASADLFVFPSVTDTMGQVVIEAQASGLPVLVSDQGGPREVMSDQVTGLVLPAADPNTWTLAIHELLKDEPRRIRMAHSGPPRMTRFALPAMFDAFWQAHASAVARAQSSIEEPSAAARSAGTESPAAAAAAAAAGTAP
jgi:glycosyltransferase involved in cell wall biosynthesis/predicted metal-dependent phosphoesterase TrpH